VFAALTLAVAGRVTASPDARIAAALRMHSGVWLDRLGAIAEIFGSMELAAPVLLIVAAVRWRRAPWQSLALLVSFALATALELTLKYTLVHQPPPELASNSPLADLAVSFPSAGFTTPNAFPSGHAVRTVFLVLFLATVLPHRLVYAGAAVWVALSALMLVYTHAHWPSDVAGGAVLGWAAFSLADLVSREAGEESPAPRSEPGAA